MFDWNKRAKTTEPVRADLIFASLPYLFSHYFAISPCYCVPAARGQMQRLYQKLLSQNYFPLEDWPLAILRRR